jgi:O-antigen ligase
MFAGLLVSRVALTIGMIGLGVIALADINPKRWFKNKWWLAGCCFVAVYAVTYFWSKDIEFWGHHTEIKLPILLLPLSFAFLPQFTKRQYAVFTVSVAMMLLLGAVYSTSFLWGSLPYYLEEYRTAHVLPTLVENDYIRFSLSISLFICWSMYVWPELNGRLLKWFVGISVCLLILYLHILAAKSGLVAVYLFFVLWGLYLIISKKRKVGIAIIAGLILLMVLAYKYIPTFHERLGYIGFTYFMLQSGDKTGLYGDIGRIISYDIAIKLIKEHPLKGVGAGDMFNEMMQGYHKWYPNVKREEMLLPHNQFLTVSLACGIPGLLVFVVWVFAPLRELKKNRKSFFFMIVWLVLLFQLMIEPVLEIQFGVFVYLFFLLWQKHTFKVDKLIG